MVQQSPWRTSMLGAIRKRLSRHRQGGESLDTSPHSDSASSPGRPSEPSSPHGCSNTAEIARYERIVSAVIARRKSECGSTGSVVQSPCELPKGVPAVKSEPLEVKTRALSEATTLSSPSSESSNLTNSQTLRRSSSANAMTRQWPRELQMHGYGVSPETQDRILAEHHQRRHRSTLGLVTVRADLAI